MFHFELSHVIVAHDSNSSQREQIVKRTIILAVSALSMLLVSSSALSQTQDNEMAKVKAIMQQSRQEQQQKRQTVQEQQAAEKAGAGFMQSLAKGMKNSAKQQLVTQGASSSATTPAAAPTIAPVGGGTVKELETQLSQLNQANLTFQQQTDQRIDVLNHEHTALTAKLTQLGQVLGILNQEITQLGQQVKTAQQQVVAATSGGKTGAHTAAPAITSFTGQLESSKTIQYVLYAILILLIIVILMLIPRRGGYRMAAEAGPAADTFAANDTPNGADTKDEYDFMGSKEAIPAKLDLARAYLAMEDYVSAQKVLVQITRTGDAEQKKEAQKMLDQIPK